MMSQMLQSKLHHRQQQDCLVLKAMLNLNCKQHNQLGIQGYLEIWELVQTRNLKLKIQVPQVLSIPLQQVLPST